MEALSALHSRTSVNLLCEPGPTPKQLTNIIRAGLRACDHAGLRPWKYLLIEGSAREKFGELMVRVREAQDGTPATQELVDKLRSKPMRAPTIIAIAADIKEHQKVPELEQLLSAGASAQMMMTAAHAQNIGAIWRSGSLMFQPEMKRGLGLQKNQQLIGFIYLGTPKAVKPVPSLEPDDFLTRWNG